ncbi:MAG: type IV pilus assembly protein PilB [Elusimicrobia bacterium]|nr:MAG: type IV pilus assembly protein PilB [Elusimicrobiota bacterium]KAF0155880.1 MAG: type IV pilus assembly protein PilB [Elusimicrobiota bacterium]
MEEKKEGRDADIGDMFRDAVPPEEGRVHIPPPPPLSNGLRKATVTPPLVSRPEPAARNAPSPAARPASLQPQKMPPPARTILVVDDNKDYRELVRHLLEVNHYKVLEAGNGIEALALIQASIPDLMLVDFNMPKMNGYELIQEVRSNVDTHDIRIIMFTGATNRQHLRALNMDITEFLEKPVPNMKLLESVARALGSRPGQPPKPAPRPAEQRAAPTAQPEQVVEPAPPSIAIERFAQEYQSPAPAQDYAAPAAPPSEPQGPAAIELPRYEPDPQPESAPAGQAVPEAQAEEVPEIEEALAENDSELEVLDSAAESREEATETIGLENLAKDSPLIQRVNKILAAAVDMRASDIHIEPQETRVSVRVRVDGVLKQLTTLPISIHPRLTARLKIMSSLVITERRIPQDGQFRVQMRGQKIEFRVSTLPCLKGEKIVLRILGQSKLNSDLEQLALNPRERHAVEIALKSPNGLVLVTGPTGSGKTTTLYTMINVLNKPDVNIMTAEDPVEYEVPNINQVKIRPAVGLTFESTLRAFLRQDPDIMLVGEIRDLETAEIAIKASITGHLVFSTLHTNSAPATITRLTHMGVAPYLVAASVKMVIAQRLVRRLCEHCKAAAALTEEDRSFLTEKETGRLGHIYRPVGCHHCHHTGYSGRKPVFEVMPIESSGMRNMITTRTDVDELNRLAMREGMTSLREAALAAVEAGTTSIGEALKIMMG